MGKIRTSPRRKTSTRNVIARKEKTVRSHESKGLLSIEDFEGTERVDTRAYLLNQANVGEAILDCLVNNDPEGVVEVIAIYLKALNKEEFRQKANIGKSTYYYLMKSKNPTIKTLAKIVHSMVH
jgi:hypothetical protein